jgi:hypothetical protein
MHRYEVIIYWSNEDEVYVAEVPELPGCMAHGDTHETALANATRPFSYGSIPRRSLVMPCRNLRASG